MWMFAIKQVCTFIYIHIHIHIHIILIYIIYIYTSVHLYIYTSTHTLIQLIIYIYHISFTIISSIHLYMLHLYMLHLYIYTSLHLYIYTSIHLYIYTSIHLYIYRFYTSTHPYIHTSIHPYIHLYIFIRFLEWKMCPRKCALAPPPSEPPSWVRPNVRHSFATPPGRNLGREWPWKSLEKLKIPSGMCINRLILVYRWFSQL